MGRHADRPNAVESIRRRWRDRTFVALAVLVFTGLGVVGAGQDWQTGLKVGAVAAAVVIAALAVSDFAARWPDRLAGILIAVFSLWGVAKLLRSLWRVES